MIFCVWLTVIVGTREKTRKQIPTIWRSQTTANGRKNKKLYRGLLFAGLLPNAMPPPRICIYMANTYHTHSRHYNSKQSIFFAETARHRHLHCTRFGTISNPTHESFFWFVVPVESERNEKCFGGAIVCGFIANVWSEHELLGETVQFVQQKSKLEANYEHESRSTTTWCTWRHGPVRIAGFYFQIFTVKAMDFGIF